MADELEQIKNIINGGNKSNIVQEYNVAQTGLNLDRTVNQIPKGQLTYALNAAVENFDSSSVNYQNEPGNELCLNFPTDFRLIGTHFINEQNKHIFFLTNPNTGDSEIGYMDNNDCIYRKYIGGKCLNFNIDYPIHKAVHKITNCTTEIYWTDGLNPRRYLDLNNLPYKTQIVPGQCDPIVTPELDCNKLKIQPDFGIPQINVNQIINVGNLTAGTYQFAVQYADASGDPYTSYYSITNPTPIGDPSITTPDFNYPVGQAIELTISNLDVTGYFQYFNLAVIKNINAISSVELVGTYFIDQQFKNITYTGQNQTQIRLTLNDIFEKFPYYEIAQDLTAVQDILVWDNLTSIDRVNYQKIANQIKLYWQTYKLPANENYADGQNSANLRGYMRDEVYAFEIVFLLANGKQTDGFHIPGRDKNLTESTQPDVPNTNPDFIGDGASAPYWKIYNTASVLGPGSGDNIGNATPYQYGEFAYWESTETYPCNEEVWGDLANKPIRHHKFPDALVSPIFESGTPTINYDGTYTNLKIENRSIFPIGVKFDVAQIQNLIFLSNLPEEQKNDIVGFKIVRGNRNTNKSIVAKGILRNVGKYEREGNSFYFPNYPYNDIRKDPFLLTESNSFLGECQSYRLTVSTSGTYEYTDCTTSDLITPVNMTGGEVINVCSLTRPNIITGTAVIVPTSWYTYKITTTGGLYNQWGWIDAATLTVRFFTLYPGQSLTVNSTITPFPIPGGPGTYTIERIGNLNNPNCSGTNLEAFNTDDSKYRYVFNSPDTSFGRPFLGTVLKLENAMYGKGNAHFVEVRKNANYKLLTREAQEDALQTSVLAATITTPSDVGALFATYQAYLTIYINGITRKNFAKSYNSIADYDYWASVNNDIGVKQREIDIVQYLVPGVQNVGDDLNINNFNRESSVYIKTIDTRDGFSVNPLPYAENTPNLLVGGTTPAVQDKSRFTLSEKGNCQTPEREFEITTVSYYGSIKNIFNNQWGQIYSYETIDTGFQYIFGSQLISEETAFGGDTFINKFSFKTKLPFFIDNRVNAPDDSDVFYDEIGNVAYPQYWHSSRSILFNYLAPLNPAAVSLKNVISIKAHNFDCPNSQAQGSQGRTYYDGSFYLFAYGIPTFYCESAINVDLRQAFNNREGDFFPHVSTGIPDNWLQESVVPIVLDNTYYYNPSYSKQNTENVFTHLPTDWDDNQCFTNFPFRAIYSDKQQNFTDNRINNWLIYRPVSLFDFPQNYGNLTSLDGIQNRGILARFENKTLLYNNLLTIDTSNPQAAYVGNPEMFKNPPIDFAETDLGYVGSQNKMLLKIPQGQITVDAKRGQVFLINGTQAIDLSAFGSGLNRFFTDHLAFEILRYFPNVPTDNHFNGVGLHGVFDSKFDRVIITKLDYIPINKDIRYDSVTNEFYIETVIPQTSCRLVGTAAITSEDCDLIGSAQQGPATTTTTSTTTKRPPLVTRTVVELTDPEYFCNKSWSLSFNFNTNSWISFHSYIPNWYIAENNFFYSGLNGGCDLDIFAAQIVPEDCSIAGTAVLIKDCSIEGFAEVVPPTTTTTTTTAGPDCDLEGSAQPITTTTTTTTETPTTTTTTTTVAPGPDCALDGTAYYVPPEPTTTTTTTTETPTTTTTTTEVPTTTTTTTVAPLDCELAGTAEQSSNPPPP